MLPSIQNTLSMQRKTILPWGTEDPVGYKGARSRKFLESMGKPPQMGFYA